MYLNAVVSILVGKFAREHFQNWRKCICKFLVFFVIGFFFGSQFTGSFETFVGFINVHKTGCFVKQGACSIQFGFHHRYHFVNGWKFDDCFSELAAITDISDGFVVSSLRNAYRLSANAQTSAIHQRHYVFNQAHSAYAYKFCRSVCENQFAGW
ncbi:hypothetical protein SDC9_128332 [bioreactor metagenome]|uniref:Uncharacterized protein n=1 Tax=bioreactor metagenome TaxID=1076179 RepID=A0A645CVU7_9ZZZZ